ncbi:MAG TPA: hypothetical protein VF192_00925 [Longimicrobiales bacterium]
MDLANIIELEVALLVRNEDAPRSFQDAVEMVADRLGVIPGYVGFWIDDDLRDALTDDDATPKD